MFIVMIHSSLYIRQLDKKMIWVLFDNKSTKLYIIYIYICVLVVSYKMSLG